MAIAALDPLAHSAGQVSRQHPFNAHAEPLPASAAAMARGTHAAAGNDHAGPDSAPCYPVIEALMAATAPLSGAPLDCIRLALDAADSLGRAERIRSVQPSRLDSFDGALYRTGAGEWTVLYSDRLCAPDARFMIAYLLGRHLLGGAGPDGVECTGAALLAMPDDDSADGRAYAFASRLLMPLAACRAALPGAVDLDALAALAQRLCLPAHHVARRWLSYTARQAVLTLSRDGAVVGTWTSETAFGLRADELGRGSSSGITQTLWLDDGASIALAVGSRHAVARTGARQCAAFPS